MLRYSIMVFIGLFSIVTGLVVFFLLADATRKAILDELVIDSETHKNYKGWTTDWDEGDEAIYFNYYLFNMTNPVEWASGDAKANFAEVGPFVYRRYINKTSVVFGDGGNDVTWNPHREYIFQPTRSVSLDTTTMIFNINPYYLGAVQAAANNEALFNLNLATGSLAQLSAAVVAGSTGISMAEATTALAMFTGNTAAFFGFSSLVTAYSTAVLQGQAATASAVATQLNTTFPGAPNFWTFNAAGKTNAINFLTFVSGVGTQARNTLTGAAGANGQLLFRQISARAHLFGPDPLFSILTGTSRGYINNHTLAAQVGNAYTVKTGKDSSSYAGMDHHTQANGVSTSRAYTRGDGSGPVVVVNGRLNTMSPFQGATPDKIENYFEDVERYATFTFNGVQEVEGIETARYLADTEELVQVNADFNVTAAGFGPLQYWVGGVPFFLSLPHQQFAAAPYSTAITGMSVNTGAHCTFVDLEPITGLPLEARLAAQNNIHMNFTATSYTGVGNVTEKVMMVPLYWSAQTFRIRADSAKDLRQGVVTAVVLRRAILGSLVGLGVVCVLIGAALMVQKGGNDGVSGENDKHADAKKAESQKQQESELPPDNEPELQPFNPPPPVGEDDQAGQEEMHQVNNNE